MFAFYTTFCYRSTFVAYTRCMHTIQVVLIHSLRGLAMAKKKAATKTKAAKKSTATKSATKRKSTTTKKATTKSTTAAKPTARKAAGRPAKSKAATSKSATAKKTTAAKKTAAKAPAKRTAAKKAAAPKKAAPKKAAAKKPAAKAPAAPKTFPKTPYDDCANANLRSASRSITQLYDRALKSSGIRSTQFTILSRIASLEEPTIIELSEALQMDRTTLTRNLRPLQSGKFIGVKQGKDDKRIRVVALTASGKRALKKAEPAWKKTQAKVEGTLGPTNYKRLLNLLGRVGESE